MKQNKPFNILLLVFSISLAMLIDSRAQTFTGDITLKSQDEVNAFNYAALTGTLLIQESVAGNITNLNQLSILTSVGGYLYVQNNSGLTSLSGLGAITSVEGLGISSNSGLTSLSGLGGITSVEGLDISSNSSLTSLSGLDSLTSVGGDLVISSNSALTGFSGLDSITSVVGNLVITNNSALTSFSGLDALSSVGGDFHVETNSALTNLSGLGTLTSVGGDLYVGYNALLTNLSGLDALDSVGGHLTVLTNTSLEDFCGLYLLLNGDGLVGTYNVTGNAVDPTIAEIIAGGACTIELSIKIYLEGPYSTANNNMDTSLGSSITLSSPYSQDTVTVNSIPPNIVDWVLVQLKNKTDPTIIIASRSAFVLNTGDVVDIDGTSPVSFEVPADDYHISVIHRNHLAVMSNAAVPVN